MEKMAWPRNFFEGVRSSHGGASANKTQTSLVGAGSGITDDVDVLSNDSIAVLVSVPAPAAA